jgi:hypothetical protein
MSDIAAQHERVIGGFALAVFIGDKGEERNGGQFNLPMGHFVEFRDLDNDGILQLFKIRSMHRLIPLQEIGVVDEVLDQEIFSVGPAHKPEKQPNQQRHRTAPVRLDMAVETIGGHRERLRRNKVRT